MSCFMVGHAHIDALVGLALWGPSPSPSSSSRDVAPGRWFRPSWYAVPVDGAPDTPFDDLRAARREARAETADAMGQMLANANADSVRCRYDDADECGMIPDWVCCYEHRSARLGRRPTAVEGLKAIACFRYQACECPDWPQSEAFRFCDALEHALIGCLAGYDEAPWDWPGA